MTKKHPRKLFGFSGFVVIAIFLWSPWMADDGGERAAHEVIGISPFSPDECDGIATRWAPFGRIVYDCDEQKYISFWGQVF